MTVHSFNRSYPGFLASEIRSSSCKCLFPARHAGKLFIFGAGNRHFQTFDFKRYRELRQQASEICGDDESTVVNLYGHNSARMFIRKRDDPNSNSNEVRL